MPSPAALAAYGECDPTLPGRIVAMAEKAMNHEQDMERDAMSLQRRDQKCYRTERRIGQFCAAGLALACIGGSVVCALYGHDWVAGVLGTTTVLGLVVVFITGRRPAASEDKTDQISN